MATEDPGVHSLPEEEIMATATATLTSRGQVTVPRVIRRRLRIAPGDRLEFVVSDDGDVVPGPDEGDITLLRGLLAASPSKKRRVTIAEMDAAILASHAQRG